MKVDRYRVMPPLSTEECAELRDSIRKHGVRVPVLRDEADSAIIDGYHRATIAESFGIDYPSEYVEGKSQAEMRSLAFELNLHRRHLTTSVKRALITASLTADPQLSDRQHARRVGVGHETVGAARARLEKSGGIRHFSHRTDPRTGNATQPATKPKVDCIQCGNTVLTIKAMDDGTCHACHIANNPPPEIVMRLTPEEMDGAACMQPLDLREDVVEKIRLLREEWEAIIEALPTWTEDERSLYARVVNELMAETRAVFR